MKFLRNLMIINLYMVAIRAVHGQGMTDLQGANRGGGRQLTFSKATCYDAEGHSGFCMFRFDCLRENGTPLTTCKDKFLFGVCCKLERETTIQTTEPVANVTSSLDWIAVHRSPDMDETKDDTTTHITTVEEGDYTEDEQVLESTTPMSESWTSEYGETADPEYDESPPPVPIDPIPLTNTWTSFPNTRPEPNPNPQSVGIFNSAQPQTSPVQSDHTPSRPMTTPTKITYPVSTWPNIPSTPLPSVITHTTRPPTGSIQQVDPQTIYQQIVTNPLFSSLYTTPSTTPSTTPLNNNPFNKKPVGETVNPSMYDGPQLLFNSWSPSHHKRIPGIPRPSSIFNADIQEKTPYPSYNYIQSNRPTTNNHEKRPTESSSSTTTGSGQASIVDITNFLLQNATLQDLELFQNDVFAKPSTTNILNSISSSTRPQRPTTTTSTTSTTTTAEPPLRVYYETMGTHYGNAVTYNDYGSTTNQIATSYYPQYGYTRPTNWQTTPTYATTIPPPTTPSLNKDNSSTLELDGSNSALDTLIALLHPGSAINVSTAAPPLNGTGIGSWESVWPLETTQDQGWTSTSQTSTTTASPSIMTATYTTPFRPPKDPIGSSSTPVHTTQSDWTSPTFQYSQTRPWITETAPMTMATPVATRPITTSSTISTTTPTTTTIKTTTTTSSYSQRPIWDYRKTCGVRPLRPTGRVVGGRNTFFGEWPWQVLVKEATWLGLFVKNKCGGVLINTKYVITAAHCQPGFLASLLVILGEYDLTGDYESLKPLTKNVRRMIVHRDYNAQTFENDIALLELDSPVILKPHIVPICLPKQSEDFAGKRAYVSGWGKLTHGGPLPNVLQSVRVPVASNSDCQRMFLSAGHVKAIRDTFICAGYSTGGRDSCEGDSGGPLMIQRKDLRWVLIGTVSHGIGCADPNLPGVYMRTTSYLKWINSIIS